AGVSGFGFGGTNAHVVVEQAPAAVRTEPDITRPGQFLLAAASRDRLRGSAAPLADWLAQGTAAALDDGQTPPGPRAGGPGGARVTAGTRDELVTGLRNVAADGPDVVVDNANRLGNGPVFVFSGHGSQWPGMGRSLLADEPAFAAAVDDVDDALRAESGI